MKKIIYRIQVAFWLLEQGQASMLEAWRIAEHAFDDYWPMPAQDAAEIEAIYMEDGA